MLKRFNSRRVSDIVIVTKLGYTSLTSKQSASHLSGFFQMSNPQPKSRGKGIGKKMVATFFSMSGHLATVVLGDQRIVTAKWYTEVCLPQEF